MIEQQKCIVPCPAMSESFKKISDHFKETAKQFGEMTKCLMGIKESKTSNKMYYWTFGGLSFFVVVVLGGFQWSMLQSQHQTSEKFLTEIGMIRTDIAIVTERISMTSRETERHLDISDSKFEILEKRLDKIDTTRHEFLHEEDHKKNVKKNVKR